MDGAATFADLVHDVLDLIAQDLVLLANLIQLKNRFLIGRLDSEEIRGCISAFLLCGVKIHWGRFSLEFPFTNKFVELLGLLFHGGIEKLGLVSLSSHVINISSNLSLGLFNLSSLKLELLNGALGFSKSGLELELVHLNVFSLGNTLSLVLASPHIRLLVSLVYLSQEITLDARLFLQMVLDTIKLMLEVLEFGHHVGLVLKFLDCFQQVSVFGGNLPLVVLKVSKSKVGLFNLLVSIIEGSEQALVGSSP